ncbi:MAG: cyclic nucleotide-binding domain-containing protein, partial [Candidatus Bathyarchaeota archaeon]|nr:cyclic nucleotide-binding domain-containing protein [Candidatus Bathyarchaeota archaeon]
GSSYYMSPEQANPNIGLDRQTDVYSLGIVLYELLAGRRPFEGENLYQILYKITHEGPPPIKKYVPDISPALDAIIKKAISKNRENRFKTAKEFADALLPIIKGKDSKALDKQDKKKIAYLRRLNFFKHFQYSDLAEVIEISTWTSHKSNTWIIEESDNDSNIYILVRGNASLHLKGEVKVFKKGECFGESAVLYNMPRHAKVMADTDCVVISINANLLNQSKDSLQVKFLKEFYKKKTSQLVDANLKLIQAGL